MYLLLMWFILIWLGISVLNELVNLFIYVTSVYIVAYTFICILLFSLTQVMSGSRMKPNTQLTVFLNLNPNRKRIFTLNNSRLAEELGIFSNQMNTFLIITTATTTCLKSSQACPLKLVSFTRRFLVIYVSYAIIVKVLIYWFFFFIYRLPVYCQYNDKTIDF